MIKWSETMLWDGCLLWALPNHSLDLVTSISAGKSSKHGWTLDWYIYIIYHWYISLVYSIGINTFVCFKSIMWQTRILTHLWRSRYPKPFLIRPFATVNSRRSSAGPSDSPRPGEFRHHPRATLRLRHSHGGLFGGDVRLMASGLAVQFMGSARRFGRTHLIMIDLFTNWDANIC